jgi:hypothetical protein
MDRINKRNKRQIKPYGSNTEMVETLGTLQQSIFCGRRSTVHNFEVAEADEDLLLGSDILPQLGISVAGIPVKFPDDVARVLQKSNANESETELHERPTPWKVKDRISEPEVKQLMDGIQDLLDENAALDPKEPACTDIKEATMHLPLRRKPKYRRQYSIPQALMERGDEQIEDWVKQGFVESAPATSDFNTPLMCARTKKVVRQLKAKRKKPAKGTLFPFDPGGRHGDFHEDKQEKLRWCMDFRLTNMELEDDDTTGDIPKICDIFERLKGFKYATTLDLKSAYHQLLLDEKSRDVTTFTWRGRRYRWVRWPFGIKSATGKFQKVLEITLNGCEAYVVIFVDDVCIFTNSTVQEHIEHVRSVLQRFNRHGLRLNHKKCYFGYSKILLLGHLLSGDTRSMDPAKAETALEYVKPTTGKQVMNFGVCELLTGLRTELCGTSCTLGAVTL